MRHAITTVAVGLLCCCNRQAGSPAQSPCLHTLAQIFRAMSSWHSHRTCSQLVRHMRIKVPISMRQTSNMIACDVAANLTGSSVAHHIKDMIASVHCNCSQRPAMPWCISSKRLSACTLATPCQCTSHGLNGTHTAASTLQAQRDGFRVTFDNGSGSEAEDWEDAMADLEDPWMREPASAAPFLRHSHAARSARFVALLFFFLWIGCVGRHACFEHVVIACGCSQCELVHLGGGICCNAARRLHGDLQRLWHAK